MAKFLRNSRIPKKYTAISKNRPPTHVKGRLLPRILFLFYKNGNKISSSYMKRMLTTNAAATILDSPFQGLASASWYSVISDLALCHSRLDRGSPSEIK